MAETVHWHSALKDLDCYKDRQRDLMLGLLLFVSRLVAV